MRKYAVALAGGGSKGIYQIGAWKALDELGIEFEALTGTSIGAINGAFMVQGDLNKAYDMWSNLRMDQCVRLPENVGLVSENLLDRQHAGVIFKELITHGGIDQSPLFDLLSKYIDLPLVYSSSIDFGLCTFSLRNRTSLKIWRSDIPQDLFFTYIMASSALPGLRPIKLDDHLYIDGGFGDNLPFDMLRRRGLRNIIAIDLRPVKNRAITTDRLRITHICNSLELGGTLDLTPLFFPEILNWDTLIPESLSDFSTASITTFLFRIIRICLPILITELYRALSRLRFCTRCRRTAYTLRRNF